MTKRLTIALIALVALVLVAVLPVSATYYDINNTIICTGCNNVYWRTATEPLPGFFCWDTQVKLAGGHRQHRLNTTAPSQTLTITNNQSFYVSPTLAAYAGNWYVLPVNGATPQLAFSVAAPSITVDVWDLSTGTTATGGSVIQGDYLAFRINSNLDQALNPAYREADQINTANTGNVDIKVKSASGNTYTALFANTTDLTTKSITQQNVNLPSWFWGTSDGNQPGAANYAPNWSTGAVDSTGQNAYPAVCTRLSPSPGLTACTITI